MTLKVLWDVQILRVPKGWSPKTRYPKTAMEIATKTSVATKKRGDGKEPRMEGRQWLSVLEER